MGIGYGYISEGLDRGLTQIQQDQDNRRKREREDTALKQQQEDRAFYEPHRRKAAERSTESGDIDAEFKRFSRDHEKAMGQFITSGGINYKPLVEMYNNRYPDREKIKVAFDPKKSVYTVDIHDNEDQLIGSQQLSKDDFELRMASMADQKRYLDYSTKSRLQRDKISMSAKFGYQPNASADIQMLNYLEQRHGMKPDAALKYFTSLREIAKVNPLQAARGLYSDALRARKDSGAFPGDPGYRDDNALWKDSLSRVEELSARFPGAQGTLPIPEGEKPSAANGRLPSDMDRLLPGGGLADPNSLGRPSSIPSLVPGFELQAPVAASRKPAAPAGNLPAAPKDPRQREIGKQYVAPDGRTIRWTKQGWDTE